MSEESFLKLIADYGLSDDEARIYLTLAKLGPSRAAAVASRLRLNRMKVYRALERLRERGIVESSLERPMRFSAVPLERTVAQLIQEVRDRIAKMEANRPSLMAEWAHMPIAAPEPLEHKIRIVQGRQQVYSQLTRMCESAEAEILFYTTRNDLMRMVYAGVYDVLRGCTLKGVKLRVLTEIDKSAVEAAETYARIAELRHTRMPATVRFVIADGKQIVMSAAMDDSMRLNVEQDIALWTDAENFVKALKGFFTQIWESASEAAVHIQAIKAGAPVEELRLLAGLHDFFELYERMIASAKSEILLASNTLSDEALPASVRQKLADARKRGVDVKILTQIAPDELQMAKALEELAELRHSRSRVNLSFIISDRAEALLSGSPAEGPGAVGKSVWTDMKSYVAFVTQIADELWNAGVNLRLRTLELEEELAVLSLRAQLKDRLRAQGWIAESPATARGESGVLHTFDLVVREKEGGSIMLVADMKVGRERMNPLASTAFYAKAYDVKSPLKCLFGVPELADEPARLARSLGIAVINGAKLEDLIEGCRATLRQGRRPPGELGA